MYGVITAAALAITRAENAEAVRDGTRATVVRIFEGLRPATPLAAAAAGVADENPAPRKR